VSTLTHNSKFNPFIHSIGMCRMRRFPSVLRSFFHSFLSYTLSIHPSPPTSLLSSLTSSCIYFFVYLSASLFPNSCIILFWEFYFLPFSVHAETNTIYLTLLSLVILGFSPLHKFLYWLIFSKFLFHCHILSLKFFYTLSFQKCLFTFYLSLLVTRFLMHMLRVLSNYCVL